MSAGTEQETEERAYVYMVRCAGGQLYTGWTNDPGARLHAHKTGRGSQGHTGHGGGAVRLSGTVRGPVGGAAPGSGPEKSCQKRKKEALCAGWEEKNLPRLSVASRADAKDILELYNWYVLHHTATFQVTPSTLEEYEDWVDNTLKVAPLLLARDADGRLLGYACAHRWHPREAYDWSVESTIYCAPDARGCGWAPCSTAHCWNCWPPAATGTSMHSWPTRTPPASASMRSWAFPAWAAPRTRRINSAGWACPPGGWRCAPATKKPAPRPEGDGRADAGCALQIRKNRMKRNEELRHLPGLFCVSESGAEILASARQDG